MNFFLNSVFFKNIVSQFFVTDPSQLQEECTRHQFYLQIRRDIYLGKLKCALSTQYLLSSYIVQGEKNRTLFIIYLFFIPIY